MMHIMDHTNIAGPWFTVILVSITVIIIVSKVSRARTASPKMRRPSPPVADGAPFIGVIPAILTKGLLAVLFDQHLKLGSVFTLRFFGLLKVTFFVGPEVSSHFFRANESELSIGDMYKFTVPIFGEGVEYAVDHDTRNEQHRFYAEILRPAKLRCHVEPMICEVEDYFAKWGECGTADFRHEVDCVLMLIASRCLLGKEVRENMMDKVPKLLHDLMGGFHLISVFFPYLPTPAHRRRDKARAKLREIFSRIIKSRKRSGQFADDMMQFLIDSRYKDGRPTTESEVTGMLFGLLFAGQHTSSVAITWTAALLLNHRECLRAAEEEQDQMVRKHGSRIDYDILMEMGVLHRSIKETLRLHPLAPMMLRRVRTGFTLRSKEGCEYDIPKGHIVASPGGVNNLLPSIYKDPHVFDPDRFSPGREEDRVGGDFAYTSFGAGKHPCLGEGYAYLQMKVILSHLLRNFELELVSPFPKPENMMSMAPQGKVLVRYKRRQLIHHA
ncbi:hypothetical protein EJB05_12253 [Eragrostis curvula]|uniref:Obtusifoliol 14-alpha demethylase n=1 Tax=Eragrostis curvula TaxID=38414 RepID=A0A5J9VSP9_9POAL|nr:hypothetical protein EJB05_12253 [Eragrostis curvula]